MLILLSPAKTLSFEKSTSQGDMPELLDHAHELIEHLKTYDQPSLARLMKLSDSLASLNVERYQQWRGRLSSDQGEKNPALFVFQGDAYRGLDAATLSGPLQEHTQIHLRILSGLYGLLKPFDHIEAHRLEMGTRLPTPSGKHQYDFWGDLILDNVEKALASSQRSGHESVMINLASQEYYKSVTRPRGVTCPVITPIFKDEKSGKFKVMSVFAKRARGLMTRHLIESSYAYPKKSIEELIRSFTSEGYAFSEEDSTPAAPLFTRSEQARVKKK